MGINVKVSSGPRISALVPTATQQKVAAATVFQGASNAEAASQAAFNQANSAYMQANSAYSYANTSIQVTGGEITGNLIVDGGIYGNVAVVDAGTF
jgi:hypothetical protein